MHAARPNLFHFATSELSQDAFLCWALAWSDATLADIDPALYAFGTDLLGALLRCSGVTQPPASPTIAVRRQVERADIVVEIGADLILVIEDKVYTSEHSNQLENYRSAIQGRYPDRTCALVYVKTGDQSSYATVRAHGWSTFSRTALLEVLRRHPACMNAILVDFRESVEAMETAVQRYRTIPPKQWSSCDHAYHGLYMALQEHLGDGQWGYVANPAGGFVGFWWNFEPVRGGEVYLQLEESELVVKISVDDADLRREHRGEWSERVVAALPGFRRPQRFGHGQYMTVATQGDYRVVGEGGLLDLDATVASLRQMTAALSALASRHR